MPKRSLPLSSFFFFFILSGLIVVFFQTGIGRSLKGGIELTLHPLQQTAYGLTHLVKGNTPDNSDSLVAVAKQEEDKREIEALRDQFAISNPTPRNLLPARIVGLKAFIPGFSQPSQIIIDKGSLDGVQEGFIIVRKDVMLGKIVNTSQHVSLVDLTTKKDFSITAKTAKTNSLGIIKGQGEGLLLDNVVLSDTLEKGDVVVTKGSMNENGIGAPSDIVIGKIVSIEKKPSALFQTAEVVLPLQVTSLDTVFVLLPNR